MSQCAHCSLWNGLWPRSAAGYSCLNDMSTTRQARSCRSSQPRLPSSNFELSETIIQARMPGLPKAYDMPFQDCDSVFLFANSFKLESSRTACWARSLKLTI